MFVYGVLPVQAEMCPHTILQTDDLFIPTGNITFNESGHIVEYGKEHTCVSCGFRFFKDIKTKFEAHHWKKSSTVATDEHGNIMEYYYCETSGCDYIEIRIYY